MRAVVIAATSKVNGAAVYAKADLESSTSTFAVTVSWSFYVFRACFADCERIMFVATLFVAVVSCSDARSNVRLMSLHGRCRSPQHHMIRLSFCLHRVAFSFKSHYLLISPLHCLLIQVTLPSSSFCFRRVPLLCLRTQWTRCRGLRLEGDQPFFSLTPLTALAAGPN